MFYLVTNVIIFFFAHFLINAVLKLVSFEIMYNILALSAKRIGL
jgi:hypothetical protein